MSGVENNSAVWTDEEIELEAKERNVRPRPQETKSEIDDRGAFVRQPNRFRTPFGDKEGELESGKGTISTVLGKGVPLVKQSVYCARTVRVGGCYQCTDCDEYRTEQSIRMGI